jgi:hypothetical protein
LSGVRYETLNAGGFHGGIDGLRDIGATHRSAQAFVVCAVSQTVVTEGLDIKHGADLS